MIGEDVRKENIVKYDGGITYEFSTTISESI